MTITLKQLRLLGACNEQVELFKAIFGKSVEVTYDVIVQYGAQFDIKWLAKKVLSVDKYADYEAKRDPLWADYEAKRAPLWADYAAKCALVFWAIISAE